MGLIFIFAFGLAFSLTDLAAQRPTTLGLQPEPAKYDPALVERGHQKFQQGCAFCHGPNANGGESGPDLTHSGVVASDKDGDKIGVVVQNGLGAMPKFNLAKEELTALAAFLKVQALKANSEEATRRKINLADLLTGDVNAGKKYFYANGRCSSCHSPTGDLAGIADRYDPVTLQKRMLYPSGSLEKITVALPSGESITGDLAQQDEFIVGLRDANGWYRSWSASEVKCKITAPAEAHLKLISEYSNADVHNLFAYLNTIR